MTKVIYTDQRSKRKPANTAAKRALDAEWQALLKKYETKPVKKPKSEPLRSVGPAVPAGRECSRLPSRDTGPGIGAAVESPKYTGSAVLGITIMHKSNLVPVFSSDEAKEVSRMRRG